MLWNSSSSRAGVREERARVSLSTEEDLRRPASASETLRQPLSRGPGPAMRSPGLFRLGAYDSTERGVLFEKYLPIYLSLLWL